jgi:hypothetical protein
MFEKLRRRWDQGKTLGTMQKIGLPVDPARRRAYFAILDAIERQFPQLNLTIRHYAICGCELSAMDDNEIIELTTNALDAEITASNIVEEVANEDPSVIGSASPEVSIAMAPAIRWLERNGVGLERVACFGKMFQAWMRYSKNQPPTKQQIE